jgi:hypothetical protein
VLPGNRVVHPYELGIIKHPWIRAFQVVQESLNCIVMRVVPFHKPTGREMAALVQPVVELVGRDVQVHVVLVPEIPMETNGKFRVYRSCIRSAYDGLSWSDQTEKPALDNGHA